MRSRLGRCIAVLLVATASWQCSRESATPPSTPPDTSSALQIAIGARSAAFVDDSERGRRAWQEAQRFYKQNGGVLKMVPDVYGIDRRDNAATGQ